jgi:magnesium-dependent phosphatase 1
MAEEKVKDEAMQIMGMFQILPRLVVFDLDYTLWPFYCECRSKREMPSMYPQAKGILSALKEKGIEMAIASRSPTSDIANTFLDKLNIKPMFVAKVRFKHLLLCCCCCCLLMSLFDVVHCVKQLFFLVIVR